jgi:hypothetical protein
VLLLGGDIRQFVPPSTERHLRAKLHVPAAAQPEKMESSTETP